VIVCNKVLSVDMAQFGAVLKDEWRKYGAVVVIMPIGDGVVQMVLFRCYLGDV
jgi:hypothetical protein